MNFKKIVLAAMSVLLVGALLTGCGDDKKAETPKKEQTKVLKVAGEVTYPPFEFADKGKYIGFDVDLSKALGKEMGYDVEYVSMGFDALIPALETKQIDVIISGMTITAEREKKISFTDSYFDEHLIAVVKKDNTSIKGLSDIANKKVGAQIGTTGAMLAGEQPGTEVKNFDTLPTLLKDVENGGVEAAVINISVAQYYIKVGGLTNLKVVDLKQPTAHLGIAINKDNKELLDKTNKALKKLKENGTYDQLKKKWFGDL